MKRGLPLLHPEHKVPMELQHLGGRNVQNPHNSGNLTELWPWEHADMDPSRYYNGPRP